MRGARARARSAANRDPQPGPIGSAKAGELSLGEDQLQDPRARRAQAEPLRRHTDPRPCSRCRADRQVVPGLDTATAGAAPDDRERERGARREQRCAGLGEVRDGRAAAHTAQPRAQHAEDIPRRRRGIHRRRVRRPIGAGGVLLVGARVHSPGGRRRRLARLAAGRLLLGRSLGGRRWWRWRGVDDLPGRLPNRDDGLDERLVRGLRRAVHPGEAREVRPDRAAVHVLPREEHEASQPQVLPLRGQPPDRLAGARGLSGLGRGERADRSAGRPAELRQPDGRAVLVLPHDVPGSVQLVHEAVDLRRVSVEPERVERALSARRVHVTQVAGLRDPQRAVGNPGGHDLHVRIDGAQGGRRGPQQPHVLLGAPARTPTTAGCSARSRPATRSPAGSGCPGSAPRRCRHARSGEAFARRTPRSRCCSSADTCPASGPPAPKTRTPAGSGAPAASASRWRPGAARPGRTSCSPTRRAWRSRSAHRTATRMASNPARRWTATFQPASNSLVCHHTWSEQSPTKTFGSAAWAAGAAASSTPPVSSARAAFRTASITLAPPLDLHPVGLGRRAALLAHDLQPDLQLGPACLRRPGPAASSSARPS